MTTFTLQAALEALQPQIKWCETEAHMNAGTKYEAVYAERARVLRDLRERLARGRMWTIPGQAPAVPCLLIPLDGAEEK